MEPGKALSAQQREAYERDGYVVLQGVLAEDVMQRYKARAREIAHGDFPPEAKGRIVRDVRVAKGLVPKPDDPEMGLWKLLNPDRFDAMFLDFLSTPRLLDGMEDIVGPDVISFLLMLIYKPPGLADAVHPLHQDAFYFPFGPHDLCAAAWVALDDADEENGSLTVVPGSHKGPVMGHEVPKGVQNFGNFQIEGVEAHRDAVTLSVKAGDCVFFHSRLWHTTAGNRSDRMRRVITVHAASASCKPTGPMPHEEFGMRLMRGRLHDGGLQPIEASVERRTRADEALDLVARDRNEELRG